MSMLERFLEDSQMNSMKRKRTTSMISLIDTDMSLPVLNKVQNDDKTQLCLKYRDKIILSCRDFVNNTLHMCTLIERIEVPSINAVSLAYLVNDKKNYIDSIVKSGQLVEKELLSLYKKFKKEEKNPNDVVAPEIKTDIIRRSLGTIKRSYEDFTDDDLFLVEDNFLADDVKNDVVNEEYENILEDILCAEVGSSLLTVKEENEKDEVFSMSTCIPEEDALEKGVNLSGATELVENSSGGNNVLNGFSQDTEKLPSEDNKTNEGPSQNTNNDSLETNKLKDSSQNVEVIMDTDSDRPSVDFGAANMDENIEDYSGTTVEQDFNLENKIEEEVVNNGTIVPGTNIVQETSISSLEKKNNDENVNVEEENIKENTNIGINQNQSDHNNSPEIFSESTEIIHDGKEAELGNSPEVISETEIINDTQSLPDQNNVSNLQKSQLDEEVVELNELSSQRTDEQDENNVSNLLQPQLDEEIVELKDSCSQMTDERAKNNCDKLNNRKQKRCTKKRITKEEIKDELRLLDEIWDISDMESEINKSIIYQSESESDIEVEEYERPAKRPKITEESDENANEIVGSNYFTVNPCYVKITREEKNACDDFYYGLKPNKCLTPRNSTSDEDIKPVRKSTGIFPASSDSDQDDDISMESEASIKSVTSMESGAFEDFLNSAFKTDRRVEDDENMDELAILNTIFDSSDSCSWTEDESNEEGKEDNTKKKRKRKKKKIAIKKEIDEKSEWKLDTLLTDKLDEAEEKEKKERNKSDESDEIKSDHESDECEDIFEIESTASDSSDIQFVSMIIGGLSQDSAGGKGRKNIRAVLSEDTLEQSTIDAAKEEKEHIERLKEKRKNLQKIRETLKEAGLVLDATSDTRIEVNPNLTKRLKTHQKKGVQFMWDACYETVDMLKTHPGTGCVLAHCMGLGKTYQVITLIHTLFKYAQETKTKHVLVICPLSTVYNWQNEFSIATDVAGEDTIQNIYSITDQQKTRTSKLHIIQEWWNSGGILIMCYESYVSFTLNMNNDTIKKQKLIGDSLIDPGPDLLICDEGHQLKNSKTKRAQMLSQMTTKRRIILTGTPIQNNLQEYYWMVQFVKPNLLGTYKEFMNRFANPIQNGQYDDSNVFDINLMRMRSHVLHSILKNTVQRIEAKELIKYLPNKYDYALFVKLHPVQAKIYKHFMEKIKSSSSERRLFMDFTALRPTWMHPYALWLTDEKQTKSKKTGNKQKIIQNGLSNEEEEIANVTEISTGWWKDLTPDDFKDNIDYGAKLTIMMSIVRECESVGDKLLIFTQYLLDLDIIEKFLKLSNSSWQHGVNYYRMDGGLSMEVRERYCKKFNDKDSSIKIFLLTHKVGGLGLNLAAANRVILMDCCWNPAYSEQSIFRIYRFGQVKECYIYRLVSMGTMEEVFYERSVMKQAVSNRVIDEMQIGRHYKSSDLMSLYRCQVDVTEEPPTPKLPVDEVLARLLQNHKNIIFKYHEHQTLLKNVEEEELNENEIKLAWENFNLEKQKPPPIPLPPPPHIVTHAQPGTSVQQQCFPSTSNGMPRLIPVSQLVEARLKANLPNIIQRPSHINNVDMAKNQYKGSKDAFLNTIDLCRTNRNDIEHPSKAIAKQPLENHRNKINENGRTLRSCDTHINSNTPLISTPITPRENISQNNKVSRGPGNNNANLPISNLATEQQNELRYVLVPQNTINIEKCAVTTETPEGIMQTNTNVSDASTSASISNVTASNLNERRVPFNSTLPRPDGVIEID